MEKVLSESLAKVNKSAEVKPKLRNADKVLEVMKAEQSKALASYFKVAFGRDFSESDIGQMLAEFQERHYGQGKAGISVSTDSLLSCIVAVVKSQSLSLR